MQFKDLRLKNIDFTIRYRPETNTIISRRRQNHIIGLQISGSAVHRFSDKKFTLSDSCIYFMNQSEDYTVDVTERGIAFSVHFTTYEPVDTPSFCVKIGKTNEILRLLEIIEKEHLSKKDNLRLASDFYILCSKLNSIYEQTFLHKDKRMTFAEEYINTHFKDEHCIEAAALKCGISRRRFNELFKESFSITPNRYLINLKIEYAKKLLKTEYFTVSQIAPLCGFKDIYYFSKIFKKETGVTPSEYKRTAE